MSNEKVGRRRLRTTLLAHLIEGKIRLSIDYSPTEIIKDLELELGMTLLRSLGGRGSMFKCW